MGPISFSNLFSKKQKPTELLRSLNIGLAVVFALQAIVLVFLSKPKSFPITTNFLAIDTLLSKGAGHSVLVEATRHLGGVPIICLVVAVLLVAALAHAMIASVHQKPYEEQLKQRTNLVRWLEYGVTNGLIIVALGYLVGISDISTILMLFILTLSSYGMYLMSETTTAKGFTSGLTELIGLVTGIIPWIVIAIYLIGGGVYGNRVSGFIYGLVISLFLLNMAGVLNWWLALTKKDKWANYIYVEKVFMIISFLTKTAFAWQVFIGLLHS